MAFQSKIYWFSEAAKRQKLATFVLGTTDINLGDTHNLYEKVQSNYPLGQSEFYDNQKKYLNNCF